MSERRQYLWSKKAGTEGFRIIASISWGCVDDGDAGISLSSSQSNGIYVWRGSLQQGNKFLYPPVTHRHPLASYSLHRLSIFTICAFYLPLFSLFFFPFAVHSFNHSHKQREKDPQIFFSFFVITLIHCAVIDFDQNNTVIVIKTIFCEDRIKGTLKLARNKK